MTRISRKDSETEDLQVKRQTKTRKTRVPGHYGTNGPESMHLDNIERGKPPNNSSAKYQGPSQKPLLMLIRITPYTNYLSSPRSGWTGTNNLKQKER
jgi:hypothetical protein